jgi:hypothetical protein
VQEEIYDAEKHSFRIANVHRFFDRLANETRAQEIAVTIALSFQM